MPADTKRTPLAARILVAVAALAAAALAAAYLLRPVAVVEPVTEGRAIDARPGSVTVTPEYSMEVKSEVGGRVIADGYHLDLGDRVKKGDVLARLDPGDLKLQIEKEQIDYDTFKTKMDLDHTTELTLESARADLANAERLNKMGSYADADLAKRKREMQIMEQKAELEKASNQQTLKTLQNALAIDQRRLQKMTLTAEFDGVVSAVYAHPGDLIGPGASVATLITVDKVVEARIAEEDFAKIRVGEKASVLFLPYGKWVYNGVVSKILPTADPATQRDVVHLDVTDIEPEKLLPGINGEVSIVVDEHPSAVIVPRRAVFGDSGDLVYVVKDGRVERRRIAVGFVWTTGEEVVKGLAVGEEVIVDGLERFRDGEWVRVRRIPSDAMIK
jgi:RND family efflux transporter MFP subunit